MRTAVFKIGTHMRTAVLMIGTHMRTAVLKIGTHMLTAVLMIGTHMCTAVLKIGTRMLTAVLKIGTHMCAAVLKIGTHMRTVVLKIGLHTHTHTRVHSWLSTRAWPVCGTTHCSHPPTIYPQSGCMVLKPKKAFHCLAGTEPVSYGCMTTREWKLIKHDNHSPSFYCDSAASRWRSIR